MSGDASSILDGLIGLIMWAIAVRLIVEIWSMGS